MSRLYIDTSAESIYEDQHWVNSDDMIFKLLSASVFSTV